MTTGRVIDDPEPLAAVPEAIPEPVAEREGLPPPSPRALELARLSPQKAAFELAWPGIVEGGVSPASGWLRRSTMPCAPGSWLAVSRAARRRGAGSRDEERRRRAGDLDWIGRPAW